MRRLRGLYGLYVARCVSVPCVGVRALGAGTLCVSVATDALVLTLAVLR